MNTGTLPVFANLISRFEQARICVMLPATESASLVYMVCIESIMRKQGLISSQTASMFSILVSGYIYRLSLISAGLLSFRSALLTSLASCPAARPEPRLRPCLQTLSALSFTCSSDSSPLTYSTGPYLSAIRFADCAMMVDLPIPGSPEIRVREPGTIPPPSTLFSSPMPESMRECSTVPTEPSLTGRPSVPVLRLLSDEDEGSLSPGTLCSMIVFQAPQ